MWIFGGFVLFLSCCLYDTSECLGGVCRCIWWVVYLCIVFDSWWGALPYAEVWMWVIDLLLFMLFCLWVSALWGPLGYVFAYWYCPISFVVFCCSCVYLVCCFICCYYVVVHLCGWVGFASCYRLHRLGVSVIMLSLVQVGVYGCLLCC